MNVRVSFWILIWVIMISYCDIYIYIYIFPPPPKICISPSLVSCGLSWSLYWLQTRVIKQMKRMREPDLFWTWGLQDLVTVLKFLSCLLRSGSKAKSEFTLKIVRYLCGLHGVTCLLELRAKQNLSPTLPSLFTLGVLPHLSSGSH